MTMELKVIGFREDFAVFTKYLNEYREQIIEDAKGHGLRFISKSNPFSLTADYDDGKYDAFIEYKRLPIGGGRFTSLEALFDKFASKNILDELDIEEVIRLTENKQEESEEEEESEDAIEPSDVSGLGSAIAHHALNGGEINVTQKQSHMFHYTQEKLSLRVKQDTLPGYIIQIISSESERVIFSAREIGDSAIEAVLKFFAEADYVALARTLSKDFDRLEAVELAARWVLEDDKFLDDVKARMKEIHNEEHH